MPVQDVGQPSRRQTHAMLWAAPRRRASLQLESSSPAGPCKQKTCTISCMVFRPDSCVGITSWCGWDFLSLFSSQNSLQVAQLNPAALLCLWVFEQQAEVCGFQKPSLRWCCRCGMPVAASQTDKLSPESPALTAGPVATARYCTAARCRSAQGTIVCAEQCSRLDAAM